MFYFVIFCYIYPIITKFNAKANSTVHKIFDSTICRYILPCIFYGILFWGLSYVSDEKWDIVVGIFAGVFFSQIVRFGNEIYFFVTEKDKKINDYKIQYEKVYKKKYSLVVKD